MRRHEIADAKSDQTIAVEDRVRARAYELYLERDRADGHDAEDWFRAEQEVKASSQPTRKAA